MCETRLMNELIIVVQARRDAGVAKDGSTARAPLPKLPKNLVFATMEVFDKPEPIRPRPHA